MDKLSPARRSWNMQRIRGKDTKPELTVRRTAHALGYRYRVHSAKLPGKPDLVFASRRKVIFVHGCFWHQHTDLDCPIVRVPKSALQYWKPKLMRNAERDAEHLAKLETDGWKILVVWECQVKDEEKLKAELQSFLESSV